MQVQKAQLKRVISRFSRKKILVIGDLILDHYVYGKADRISPEAPVPVVWANKERFVCGGAANVGLNLSALGANVSICGAIGNDHFGKVLNSLITDSKINTDLLIVDKNRPTTMKSRILAGHQQIVRLDWESVEFLNEKVNRQILEKINQNINDFDAVIIEDYGKGVINPELVGDLVSLCKKTNKVVTVDPKEEHFDYYQGVTSLTPNLKEAQAMANLKIKNKSEIPLLGSIILEKLQPRSLLITLGEDGMILFVDNKTFHIPTAALEVFDVTGAGDTVIAAFTLGLSSQASFFDAAVIANLAAGITVGKLGAATTNKNELFKKIDDSFKG
jgi:D-beta-D-heptose 7-phosphate kinase/D-beta-D-heptose 1-phosphate adenosyltransferase